MKASKKMAYLSAAIALSANAFDYKVSGAAESFTKAGFNNQKVDTQTGAAPTESFTSIFGQLNLDINIAGNLKAGLGGSIGGLAFDSTSNQKDANSAFTPVQQAYYGVAWDKHDGNGKLQNYMIHNAFVSYEGENLYLKAGRYEAGNVGEYFSGYNQGAEGYAKLSSLKLWGFWSNRRAFAYNQWFNDFYRVHGKTSDNKRTLQTYAAGLDIEAGILNLSLFSYVVENVTVAPGASITLDTNKNFENQGFRSVTKLRTLFPQANKSQTSGKRWGEIERSTATLYLEQKFYVDTFNFGAGYYQNFGNANELIGRWGNPLSVDIWTAGAWDIGNALNDIIAKNAITGYGFFGADYGKFDWQILARGTNSLRSAEQSVALLLNYKIRDDITIGGKIEWFSDTTKKGYSPLAYGGMTNSGKVLEQNRTDDRSHAFFYINHSF